jgi:hypothetical protein
VCTRQAYLQAFQARCWVLCRGSPQPCLGMPPAAPAALNSRTHVPRAKMLNFSMYQSGIDVKCPYSNRPLKPSTPLIGSTRSLFSGT